MTSFMIGILIGMVFGYALGLFANNLDKKAKD
jgi:NhaP-type Na+/H+ or K+/H+ antiporter